MTVKVMAAYPMHDIRPGFHISMVRLLYFDHKTSRHLDHENHAMGFSSNNLASGRNQAVREFLKSDCEWLWFVDTDQTFRWDILEQLLRSAHRTLRPVLSALIQARRDGGPLAPACSGLDDEGYLRRPGMIPAVKHWDCIPGTGCVVIHRTVLEAVKEAKFNPSFPWFEFSAWRRPDEKGKLIDDVMGEDYTFMLRARQCGFSTWVDTTIHAGHLKETELTVEDYYRENPHVPVTLTKVET